jgi:hypothetical protein
VNEREEEEKDFARLLSQRINPSSFIIFFLHAYNKDRQDSSDMLVVHIQRKDRTGPAPVREGSAFGNMPNCQLPNHESQQYVPRTHVL